MQINKDRLLKQFIELTKINAPSYKEKPMYDYMESELKKLGCKVWTDNIGKQMNSNAKGNLFARMEGTIKSAPFILGAHLDTVIPCENVKALVKNGKVVSDGTTILTADDRAGVAMILEILRTLKESKEKYPPIEAIFTLCEEDGMYGAKLLDPSKLKGTEGLLLDDEFGEDLIINAPKAYSYVITITGKAAHAGVEPEKGISALEVASYAISIMKLGRIDKLTVANLGIISGGTGTNVVMPNLVIRGEARSRNIKSLDKRDKHIKECFDKAIKKFTKKVNGKTIQPIINIERRLKYPLLDIPKNKPFLKEVMKYGEKNGIKMKLQSSGGGFDANHLFSKGLLTPIIGIGYHDNHTVDEWLDLEVFYKVANCVLDIAKNYKK